MTSLTSCASSTAFLSPLIITSANPSFTNRSPRRIWSAVTATPPSTPAKSSPKRISPRVEKFLSRAREGNPLRGIEFAEKSFDAWKKGQREINPIVHDERHIKDDGSAVPFDVVVAGGTLGIFYATALAARGCRVAVVERGRIQGRKQEWNISREEIQALVKQNVLTQDEVEAAIVNDFTAGSRIAFPVGKEANEIIVQGVLNLGVDPSLLVAAARERFINLGGSVFEYSTLERVGIRENSCVLTLRSQATIAAGDGALGAGGTGGNATASIDTNSQLEMQTVRSRMLIDCMGCFSPIAGQSRNGQAADGACITVGACLSSDKFVDAKDRSDLICAFDGVDVESNEQYFWEKFPAGRSQERRTTYMFSYGKCDPSRQTLAGALDSYVRLVPQYQQVNLDDVQVERVLFAFFPCFKDSPAKLSFDRILPVGDAAGHQSPITFGGFAACTRHLGRTTDAVFEALEMKDDSLLKREELQRLQFYNPSLSVAWLFNSFMSAKSYPTSQNRNYINELLWNNMKAMDTLGPQVQKPFLQDVVRAKGLISTVTLMMVQNPPAAIAALRFGSPIDFFTFLQHLVALCLYTASTPLVAGLGDALKDSDLNPSLRYKLNRLVDAVRYGSGLD